MTIEEIEDELRIIRDAIDRQDGREAQCHVARLSCYIGNMPWASPKAQKTTLSIALPQYGLLYDQLRKLRRRLADRGFILQ